jgi:deoxyribodipyrimidine photolyase
MLILRDPYQFLIPLSLSGSNENYADVRWEVNGEMLQAWKDGKTGVPIVDAGMRQLKEMGISNISMDSAQGLNDSL